MILIVAPWSSFWDRNGIAWLIPTARAYLGNDFVRGAVSGVGFLTAGAGLVELAGVFGLRRPHPEETVSRRSASADADPLRRSTSAKADGEPHMPVE